MRTVFGIANRNKTLGESDTDLYTKANFLSRLKKTFPLRSFTNSHFLLGSLNTWGRMLVIVFSKFSCLYRLPKKVFFLKWLIYEGGVPSSFHITSSMFYVTNVTVNECARRLFYRLKVCHKITSVCLWCGHFQQKLERPYWKPYRVQSLRA